MNVKRWIAIGLGVLADSREVGRLLKQHPERVRAGRDWLLVEEEQDNDSRELRHLALWRRRTWNAADAVEPYERLVAVRARAWGADHPLVLDTRLGLAAVRAEAGNVAGAGTTYEHLLSDMVRVLGEDHPRIPWVRRNLAHWRRTKHWVPPPLPRMNDLEGRAREDALRDEPHDTAVMRHLAQVRWRQGDEAGAVEAYEHVLTERLRAWGPDHDVVLVTRLTMADMRAEAGDVAGALEAYENLLADMVRVHGPEHRGTRWTRHKLTQWRGLSGGSSLHGR
ncbi:tetratricopeptide repeat protein [Streptomyces sp. NBC_01716]|uniref:tetratricopeptide repeat protein n=1 Tax=Streptomyces sp. NBC_01716 TaxID=2975917 RepID=UPI002E31B23C|nr:tetratricopeptide repeat protein [Streptomyces sp. NBC_01716]